MQNGKDADFSDGLSESFVAVKKKIGATTSGQGPRFVREPPSRLRFHNSTGGSVECSARGHPTPELRWLALDDTGVVPGTPALDLSGLRRVRADGSLEFLPFHADEYRQDVHSATYRCLASNRIGVIGSRDVHVRAGECSFFG
ncbi:hypothetical protein HPB51_007681 [Rhipicephalus microplus]|uniref:Ig-like domain-containing protein n=1 Tax=Rhipicephalus microplus TaxID=6941 RepID=A0A9J6DTT7_RHIMP|nr:hypothetical protein HPB51_007681 [Rhipicephalus microplus]